MGANGVRVEVRGLRELQRAFKQVDGDIPKEVQRSFKAIAERVASVASAKVPRLTGKAAGSIKPRATQRGAAIAFSDSGGSVPYYPWLDFGGRVGKGRSVERSIIPGGRYIYPAIAAESDNTGEAAEDAVTTAAKHAKFEVRGL